MSMSAWKRIACGAGALKGNRLEIRIQKPGTGNTEGDLQSLNKKAGAKISKTKTVGKLLIRTPEKPADHNYDKGFLGQQSNSLKKERLPKGVRY